MTGKEHRRDFPDHIIQEAADRFGIPNMTADWWREHMKLNDLFCALCQAVSEIKEERKAILSFIEETVDWDGIDYEKLTNWIKERGIDMEDKKELLPCPFCGSKAYLGTMYVRCHECGCEGPLGPYQEEEEGIALWNTRAVLGETK